MDERPRGERERRMIASHDDDHPHEECGVFGLWGATDAAALTALGLHALQHRGQESTGIVTYDEGRSSRGCIG